MAATPLRGRAAAEAAAKAKAKQAAEQALQQRDELLQEQQKIDRISRLPPASLPPAGLPPAAPSKVADGGQGTQSQVEVTSGLSKGGLAPEFPYRPVFPALEVDSAEIRSMRREFEGAIAEYNVQAKAATEGLGSAGGAGFVKRFGELEAAWGKFQWNQRSNTNSTSHGLRQTQDEVQAMASAMSVSGFSRRGIDDEIEGLDLEQEVDSVLDDIWHSLEEEPLSLARRRRPKQVPIEAAEARTKSAIQATITDLDRLEANILKRIDKEEQAEKAGLEFKSHPFGAQCPEEPVTKTTQSTGGWIPGGTSMYQEPTTASPSLQRVATLSDYLELSTGRAIDQHERYRQDDVWSSRSNWFGDLTSLPSPSSQAIPSTQQSPPHTHWSAHSPLHPPHLSLGHCTTPSSIPMVHRSETWTPLSEPVARPAELRARPRPIGSNGYATLAHE